MPSVISLRASAENSERITEPAGRKSGWLQNCWTTFSRRCQAPSGAGSIWPAILSALFVSLVCLTVPTVAPDFRADASWCAVLQWAHTRGLQFGTQIVFTYGPLGYLLSPYCLEPPGTGLILLNAVLCFVIALGLCLVAWRLGIVWRTALLAIFVLESANAEMRADLLLQVGILCWGLLCIAEAGRRQKPCAAMFIGLAALAALIKVVYLFVAAFAVGGIALYLAISGERRLSWALVPGFAGTLLVTWLGCGQALAHLGPFIQNAFLISREYDQAAGLEGLPMLRYWGVVLGLLALMVLLLRVFGAFQPGGLRVRWRRAVLFGWIAGLLLFVWKHSLVRMDRFHFFGLAVFCPVAALALEALPGASSRARTLARGLTIAIGLFSFYIIESSFLPGLWPSAAQVYAQFAAHSRWIFLPSTSRERMRLEVEERRREADLPRVRKLMGGATVDVFGFHQAHALLNGLNYTPRPIFQSYAAYTPQLARLNEQFYLSAAAPEYVLFELAGLEHRFAAMDDAMALRTILTDYRFVATESGFLLLKRHAAAPAKLSLLQEGTFDLGSRLDLSAYPGADLWLEMHVQPTWGGRLLKFIYRPASLRVSAWENSLNGLRRVARRQVAPSLLRGGFVASPFFMNTQQVENLYRDGAVPRLAALSLEPTPGTEGLWRMSVHFKLYKMESRLAAAPGP